MKVLSLTLSALFGFLIAPSLNAQPLVNIDTVFVGDAGNAPDDTGFGDVSYEFSIGKYEVLNSQYTAFLNAVDPTGANGLGLFSEQMQVDGRGGISLNELGPVGAKYELKPFMGNKPVNFVDWYSAARFANWLNNGATLLSGTETGAYSLEGASSGVFTRNAEATWWIPSQDEWYKAAYYKGGGNSSGYWDFPTRSDSVPTYVTADAEGNGSAGSAGNNANFNPSPSQYAEWNGIAGNVTTAGSNGGPSEYGTFDQGGNLWEWTEEFVTSTSVAGRGGAWGGDAAGLRSYSGPGLGTATGESSNFGFRVATVPEPSTYALLVLSAIGLFLWSRRRQA